jgi:hypothetical protein
VKRVEAPKKEESNLFNKFRSELSGVGKQVNVSSSFYYLNL